ncbi:MAG: type I DNA topoisomerase [Deltaproteobacteria bacterium]|nr:type I DNA topoisomerase [Deltaproteobacteria bacterium]
MMSQSLVIVESPTKARTIKKFLPSGFQVKASMGHVRDLPQSASDIPKAYKSEPWSRLGVNVEKEFEPLYLVPKDKKKVIKELKEALKGADALYLATDEDREGESISWHLMEVLKPKVPVYRMVFHEITKSAIQKALKDCRQVDANLVHAQETRRILDRLVGFSLSPLLWKKIAYGLSAGRVQSAGLRLIVERERERIAFRQAQYWDLLATLGKGQSSFDAKLIEYQGKRIAQGKDFDSSTGALVSGKDLIHLKEDQAQKLQKELSLASWKVKSLEEKESSSHPAPPFITSTLQQEANRKLRLSAREAMRTAQRLYEQGFITYMRTDSVQLSQEGLAAARQNVESLYGKEYLSPEPRQYKSSSKSAQEAHEAIRPAGNQFVHPQESGLSGVELKLYELIWKRTLACQMASAKKLSLQVKVEAKEALFTASGTRILFPGFLRAYVEGSDDPEAALESQEVLLPDLKKEDLLDLKKLEVLSHETKPPARYTEASLVQTLEKEGIGRPSTYASIISTILERGYVNKVANALVPTFTGMAVVQLLERHFGDLVDYSFTSQMEGSLDEIAEGKRPYLPYLKDFYLGGKGLKVQVESKEDMIDPEESRSIKLPKLGSLQVKVGRYGPYVIRPGSDSKKDESRASLPQDLAPADLDAPALEEILKAQKDGPKPIGVDPKSGQEVYCLLGRYGAYLQLGKTPEDKKIKPRRASLPKGMDPREVDLSFALKLLSLPRDLGLHPETGKMISANNGRFGPYVVHEGDFRSLKKEDDVYTISLERALELLAEPKGGRRSSKLLKELGEHPKNKKPVQILSGRYGPYVKSGRTNASLPKEMDPEKISLEEALKLLEEKSKK